VRRVQLILVFREIEIIDLEVEEIFFTFYEQTRGKKISFLNLLSPFFYFLNHKIKIEMSTSHFGFISISQIELSPEFLRARSYDPRVFADQ